jgi:DNA-binding PadR family transcriptional regulator
MRNAILAVLAAAPAHGYELKQAIEKLFGDLWPPVNIGQIYTTLARLERDGLVRGVYVAQESRPDKRVYELTDDGRRELRKWIDTPSVELRLKDEFFTKLILAGLPGVADGSDPAALIERQRTAFLRSLRDLNDLALRHDAGADTPALLLIEGALLHLQADLKWLDLCADRLTKEG